jgi:succinate dehydrogenase hydrophobic anchor subunit
MGIPRGFLRLAVFAGFVGFLVVSYIFATDPYHHWNGSPVTIGDYVAEPQSLLDRFALTVLYIGVPMFLTLLFGWIVARFHRSGD